MNELLDKGGVPTSSIDPTRRAVAEMLVEDTGTHFLDSGGAGKRRFLLRALHESRPHVPLHARRPGWLPAQDAERSQYLSIRQHPPSSSPASRNSKIKRVYSASSSFVHAHRLQRRRISQGRSESAASDFKRMLSIGG